MSTGARGALLRDVQRLCVEGAVAGQGDGPLLAQYAAARAGAETAFEALVQRHGPMVLQVCRRILKDRQAAGDAFQATFLVLARRSGSVQPLHGDSLGPWLHQVATRCALKARTANLRRETRERRAAEQASAHNHHDTGLTVDEYRILHEEVERLPEKYRAPIVLCYFEGLTHDAAAVALRWPLGTVRGRLARARDQLRRRLTTRGLAPAAAVSLLTVESVSVRTAFSSGLLESTIALTADVAAPSAVASLVSSMLRGLMLGRLRRALALLTVALAVGGAGVAAVHALASFGSGDSQAPPMRLVAQPARRSSDSTKPDLQGDPLPQGAAARLGSTRFNHGSLVNFIAYSPDGSRLASIGWDHVVRFWDPKTGRVLRELGFAEDSAHCFAFAPDGKTLAIGTMGKEGKLILIDVHSGKELRRSEPYKGSPWSIAVSPDGTLIATGDANAREVILWDVLTLKPRRKIQAHRLGIWAVAFTADGKSVVTGGSDTASRIVGEVPEAGSIALFEAVSGREIKRIPVKDAHVAALAVSQDGSRLAMGCSDGAIRLFDLATGNPLVQIELATEVKCLRFSPDGKMLATGGTGVVEREEAVGGRLKRGGALVMKSAMPDTSTLSPVNIYDTETGQEIRSIPAHVQWVADLAYAPDGKTLATCGAETVVRLWDPFTGRDLHPSTAPRSAIRSLAFAPEGHGLVTGGYDGTIRDWHTTTGRQRRLIGTCGGVVQAVTFLPDGKGLITGSYDMTCQLWDVEVGREVRRYDVIRGWINQVAVSPDGRFLVTGMRRYDLRTGQEDAIYRDKNGREFPTPNYLPAVFTPDGTAIIAKVPHEVRAWDAASGRLLGTVATPPQQSFVMALSPDGRILATGGEEDTPSIRSLKKDFAIRLWETASGREIGRLEGLGDVTISLAFSPDGRLLASGGGSRRQGKPDHSLHLWDLATLRELRRLDGHRNQITGLAISPDGRWLASASEDATVLIWDFARLGKVPELARPAQGDLDRLWDELAGDDAARAYQAAWSSAALPDSTVPLLAGRMKPVERAGVKEEEWPIRAKEVLGQLRTIAVLERIGSPAARKVLGAMTTGAQDFRVTRDAKAALWRLERPRP